MLYGKPRSCRLSNNSINTMTKFEYSNFTLSVAKLIVLYFLCYAIALKKLAPIFHLIIEIKPTMTRSCTFSRASRLLQVITSSFDWLTVFSMSFVIGWANTSVGFTHSFTKKLWTTIWYIMVIGLNGVQFVNHEYDYRLNWTTWCPVTN